MITGRHFEMKEELKQGIKNKIQRLRKYFNHIIDVHVIISREKERYISEIILSAKKIKRTAKEENNDLYYSLNKAIDKIESQLAHLKDKIKNKGGR